MSFPSTYGQWAVVAGASDGVGEAFAEEVARRGLNVVLMTTGSRATMMPLSEQEPTG